MVVFPLTKKKEKKNSLNDYLLPNKLPQIPPIPSLLIITAGRTIHTYRFDCFRVREFSFRHHCGK